VLVTNVSCVNAAELIKMLFGIWTHLDQETCIRWGPGCPRRRVSFFWGGDVVDIVTALSALALLVGCQEEHPER